MKLHTYLSYASLIVLVALLTGCVSHSLLIKIAEDGSAEAVYQIKGDSLDVFDQHIPLPGDTIWTQVERYVQVDSSGTYVARLTYHTSDFDQISHPLAPSGENGMVIVDRYDRLFWNTTIITVEFPSWQAHERYGDPDDYVPEDLVELEQAAQEGELSDSVLAEKEWLEQRAVIMATVNRFLRQYQRMVRTSTGESFDNETLADAIERFSPILRAQVMRQYEADNDTIDWYPVIRDHMARAASEATGVPESGLVEIADSLHREYLRWEDLQDDTIELVIVMEQGGDVSSMPDPGEVRGDTLIWTVSTDSLAENGVRISVSNRVVQASAVTVTVIIGVLIVIAAGFLIAKGRRGKVK